MPERGSIACCGFNELVFTGCQSGYPSDLDDFKTWLAHGIAHVMHRSSKHIFVVGIPTKVGSFSQYNMTFYERLHECLKEFGCKPIANPYVNKNSSNTIVVLAGQMP